MWVNLATTTTECLFTINEYEWIQRMWVNSATTTTECLFTVNEWVNSTNVSEFSDATSFHNQSRCIERYRLSDVIGTTYYIIGYASVAVGIPGNILSAIVWLRRRKTSSAVYLAALAVNDLTHLPASFIYISQAYICGKQRSWWCDAAKFIFRLTAILEPLLVLSFSAERLFAILRPIKVCRYYIT